MRRLVERLVDEVGREPGRLRIGLCLKPFTGVEPDQGCVQAARDAARLLEGLGHHVEEAWPAALYDPDLLGGAHELGRRARRARARRMVGRPRPRARRRRRRADHVDGGLDGASALRGRRGACTRATRGADARRPELVGWLRPAAHADDRRARPAARRLQAGGFAPGRGSAFTRVFNATGQPAVSLPLGWPADGLPRGVQLVAAHGRDDVLIRIGAQLEAAAPWFDRRPPLA